MRFVRFSLVCLLVAMTCFCPDNFNFHRRQCHRCFRSNYLWS